MVKKVLIVDDDHIWVRAIKKQFEIYAVTFTTLTAGNGKEAISALKENTISLVVTDVQMPEMDGLALLAYLSATYPDIPVIIMTAYSTPTTKGTVLEGGASGYIEKPFVVEDLAEKIIGTLNKQSEGGTLQTVPLDMFIQLIEMEQKTCTIRVINKIDKRLGVLFFSNGDIMDARVDDQQGIQAAYQIFGWEKVTLSIQDECPIKEKRIDGELQAILFDAMRMKDESGLEAADFGEPGPNAEAEDIDLEETAPTSLIDTIRDRYRSVSPNAAGLEDVYPDASWSPLLRVVADIGGRLGAGGLKTVLVKSSGASDYILMQDDPPVVVAISDAAPTDKILDVLSQ